MATTHGHGHPNWIEDEVILALELYHAHGRTVPKRDHPDVIELSRLLRAFPFHAIAARQPSFRNADGVAFKLQNLHSVATGKGLSNVSRTDRAIWQRFGLDQNATSRRAAEIRFALSVVPESINFTTSLDPEFAEGRVVTYAHHYRERDPRLRQALIASRLSVGSLRCDMCGYAGENVGNYAESVFEVHHLLPLSRGARVTKLRDVALLCANCHRAMHSAIAAEKRWLSLAEGGALIGARPPVARTAEI